MNLVVVSHYYPSNRSGLEIAAGNIATRLAARGWEVTWAAGDATPPPPTPVRAIPMRAWNGVERWTGVPYPVWSPGSLARLAAAVRRADAVHVHDPLYFGSVAAFAAARRYRKPVVVTQHISPIPHASPLLRAAQAAADRTVGRLLLAGADRAVFPARRLLDFYSRRVPFRTAPVYIPHGVDTDLFRPAADPGGRAAVRARLGLAPDRPAFLFVGRFVEKKGLRVLRAVADQLPGCDFLFAGRGPLDPAGWGLPNVRAVGSLAAEELVPYYQAADLLLLPSVSEAFPLVIQEAMACGTPALISDETATGCPGVEDWAVVCPPRPEPVLAAVRAAAAAPDRLAGLRARVVEHARREWHWDQCVDDHAALFEELVRRPRRAAGRRAAAVPGGVCR